MKRSEWVSACSAGSCVEVAWQSACATGNCVEVGWQSACGTGSCVEVSHQDDRVLVRDSKASPDLKPLAFTLEQWGEFITAALKWDREATLYAGGARLMNTQLIATEMPVCVADEQAQRHLHFSWQEWDEFLEGVKAGRFSIEEQASG